MSSGYACDISPQAAISPTQRRRRRRSGIERSLGRVFAAAAVLATLALPQAVFGDCCTCSDPFDLASTICNGNLLDSCGGGTAPLNCPAGLGNLVVGGTCVPGNNVSGSVCVPPSTATPTTTPTSTPSGTPTSTPSVTPTSTPTSTPTNSPTGTPTIAPNENSGGDQFCNDSVSNDADTLVDCADPDCADVPPCSPAVPVASPNGMVALVAVLLLVGLAGALRLRSFKQ